MAIAFIVSVISLVWVAWKYRIYRRPDETGRRANGTTQRLIIRDAMLYTMLLILTFSETLFGLFAMTLPPPDNRDTPAQETIYGLLTIGVAVLVVVLAVASLWIGIVAFRGGRE